MVKYYHSQGLEVVIYTARPWSDHADIIAWLHKHNLYNYISQVVCGKPLAGIYIDDRAYNPWTVPSD
jgi:hypothetical protein